MDFFVADLASACEILCVLVLNENIFDDVIDQFFFLRDKVVDGDFVTLTWDYWFIVIFLVETVKINTVFFLGIYVKHIFILLQDNSHLLLDEVVIHIQNYFQQH